MQQQMVAIATLLMERVIDKLLYEYLSRPVSTCKKGVSSFVELRVYYSWRLVEASLLGEVE